MFDLTKHKDGFFFVPLGGANEIGMNFNLYHYKGKWLLVDLGIGFCDQDLPGVDVILPKLDFIEKYKDDIVGLVLTHAHEDHIGGIPYLLQYLNCPMYATKFTAEVVKAKLAEFAQECESELHEVSTGDIIDLEPFSVEMVHITHSIPEMHGLMIRTEKGNIFHSGDYCLDPRPIEGDVTDEEKLRKLGDEGVLAFVGDSTNIFTDGTSGSEGELGDSLCNLVTERTDGMAIITTFASNIARLKSIALAGQKSGRKISVAGRALWRMYNAARAAGYLNDVEPFLPTNEVKNYKRSEILLICTGCQGETLAATNKMADGRHPDLKIEKGDYIIFSSKIIPGNEKKISALLNKFSRMGIEVLTERDHFVHVSGHPARDEVRKMYELLRPHTAIPVHGETLHLHEHCRAAIEFGISNAVEVKNGAVVDLGLAKPAVVGEVESGYLAVDGMDIIDEASPIFKERRAMRDHGQICVILLLSGSNRLIRRPRVIASGILDRNVEEDRQTMEAMCHEIKNIVSNKGKTKDKKSLTKSISRSLEKICFAARGKSPKVLVYLEMLN